MSDDSGLPVGQAPAALTGDSSEPLDSLGMKWATRTFHVRGDAVVKECAGCGFPIDATHKRSFEVTPGAALYSHYGPCCAPRGKALKKARRRVAETLTCATLRSEAEPCRRHAKEHDPSPPQ